LSDSSAFLCVFSSAASALKKNHGGAIILKCAEFLMKGHLNAEKKRRVRKRGEIAVKNLTN